MFVALAAILYVLALAMIGVGGSLVMEGFPILTIDRGVAYYNSGVALTTGGLLLLGIATLVLCLAFIHRALKQRQNVTVASGYPAAVASLAAVPAAALSMEASHLPQSPALEARAPEEAVSADPGHEAHDLAPKLALDDVNSAMEAVRTRGYSSDVPPAEPVAKPEDELSPPVIDDSAAMQKSAFGYYSALSQPPALEPVSDIPVADSSDSHLAAAEAAEIETPVAEPEVLAATAAQEAVQSKPAPTVVGSYESGGNRYVMYSDGSIDAHLPSGVRTFLSLDELKQFVSTASATA